MKKVLFTLFILALLLGLSIEMALPVSAASPGWILVQTLTIDSNSNQAPPYGTPVNSQVSTLGKTYLIEASGTYYANDGITADAKYCTRAWEPTWPWQDDCGYYEPSYPHVTELMVDGAFVDWGEYNPEHVYTKTYSGTGSAFSFAIYDLGPNNTGSLTVRIYEAYGFNGLLAPYSASKAYKINSSIPLKWQYTDTEGNVVDSAGLSPLVEIFLAGPGGGDVDGTIELNDSGQSGLRYDSITMTWQYNWQTKGLTAGTYNIYITEQSSGVKQGPFPVQLR